MTDLIVLTEVAGVFLLTILALGARDEIRAARNRRCGWCAVRLRWWQLHWCRRCALGLADKHGFSPPCLSGARLRERPDRWSWK